jgi:membrane associated rhomboid family serine protease
MPDQQENGPPLFTYAAMATLLAFFGAQYKQFDLSKFYAFQWRVADGELWRLITCTFLHSGVMHIAFNAILFLRFSTVIDNWLGPWAAMLLYVFFAMSSNAAQLLVSNASVIGASGVVYGLFGFLWVMSRRRDDAAEAANRHTVETMLAWLGICALINYFGGNIGNTAHAMGLLLGWLVGQTFVARKTWRIPLALTTLAVWAIPLILIQPAVWNRTLAYVPPFSGWYSFRSVSPEERIVYEGPEYAPDVGLFSSQRR